MRIDKYLKNARLIKRRALAKEACDQGKIKLNDKLAKPGSEVKVGDHIMMTFGPKTIEIVVQGVKEHVTKEDAKELYAIVKEVNE